MHTKRFALTLILAALVVLAACGNSKDDSTASAANARMVKVAMADNAYTPTEVAVTKGETIRFVFTNNGKVDHEAFLGKPSEQEDHEMEMSGGNKNGGHDMGKASGGDAPLTVDAGKTGDFTHRFADAGTFQIGCHEPGHYQGGMKMTITVS